MHSYSIFDSVAKFYIQPFFAENDGTAVRMFILGLGDSWPHRSDFTLYRIGSFDTETGEFSTTSITTTVIAGHSLAQELDPRVSPKQEISL